MFECLALTAGLHTPNVLPLTHGAKHQERQNAPDRDREWGLRPATASGRVGAAGLNRSIIGTQDDLMWPRHGPGWARRRRRGSRWEGRRTGLGRVPRGAA